MTDPPHAATVSVVVPCYNERPRKPSVLLNNQIVPKVVAKRH